jgi:hypothetical protein
MPYRKVERRMIESLMADYGSFILIAVLLGILYYVLRHTDLQWTNDIQLTFLSDEKEIRLCHLYADIIQTDMVFHQNVEVTASGKGIIVKKPFQESTLVHFKAETIDEVQLKPGQVKILTQYPYALVDRLTVKSKNQDDLELLAKSAETLMRVNKRRNRKKPDRLLKKRSIR